MNPEQQRIAIAEACGWKQVTRENKPEEIWEHQKHPLKICRGESKLPDYLNDLNAMHSAILSLTPKQRLVFSDILNSIIPNGFYDDYYDGWVPSGNSLTFSESIFHIATAPTEMLAEAFLKTLNLWKP